MYKYEIKSICFLNYYMYIIYNTNGITISYIPYIYSTLYVCIYKYFRPKLLVIYLLNVERLSIEWLNVEWLSIEWLNVE